MRHLLAALALAGAALAPLATLHAQDAYGRGPLSVPIDQSLKVAFAAPARDVVVANPMIADVMLLESGAAIVMGKEYGLTTITAFDGAGRTVFARQVVVVPGDDNRVAVYRGVVRGNFVCASTCEQVAMPGEPQKPHEDISNPYTGYSGRARTAATPK